MRYCRGIDRCDEELVRSVFHADAWVDYGTFKGNGWEFAGEVMLLLQKYWRATMHFIGTELVDVQGDLAYSEAYFVAYHRLEREGKDCDEVVAGRYIDRFERRQGAWKIASRVVVIDWSRVDPVQEPWPAAARFTQGCRSREDLAYRR